VTFFILIFCFKISTAVGQLVITRETTLVFLSTSWLPWYNPLLSGR